MSRTHAPSLLGLLCLLFAIACNPSDSSLPAADDGGTGQDSGPIAENPPIVILMIGDGMGKAQLEAASRFRHGSPDALFLQSLPHHGELTTASLSGTTDSAAAATAMATGEITFNAFIGVDRDGAPLETLVESAKGLGYATGIVSTAYLPHATPAAFTAHHGTRHEPIAIANDQSQASGADVMLGGGRQYFLPAGEHSTRDDEGLLTSLSGDGYAIAQTADELQAIEPDTTDKVLGIFADEHMDYVRDRVNDEQPTLREMSLKALDILAARETGLFLMVEGARIDMASHDNDLQRTIDETLAFDDAVSAVSKWAEGRENVTILVTSDHECGGLEILEATPAEELPQVRWRWGVHTNARVDVYGQGPQSEVFEGEIRDHRWVHASLLAALTQADLVAPPRLAISDGHLSDLRYQAAEQLIASGFGEGFNELDAMHVDADASGLTVGLAGIFEADANALLLFVDTDVGSGAGLQDMASLSDRTGQIDSLITSLPILPSPYPGFAPEFVVASIGATAPHKEEVWEEAGLRGLVAPHGASHDFGWYGIAMNFGEGVRAQGQAQASAPSEGLEVHLPWSLLYPNENGAIPAGARVGLSALLVNTSGSFVSNQALPAFAAGTANPGGTITRLPGAIEIALDTDENGKVDAELQIFD